MKRLYILLIIAAFGTFGCGGGGGGMPAPVDVAGTWVGTMDHEINGEVLHYPVALVLLQEESLVTGSMILEYGQNGHGGRIDGEMRGSHFTGTRTSRHVVEIEFDVTDDVLVGNFTFVSPSENLDEHGVFICNRRQ
jgi:hypothetical protein